MRLAALSVALLACVAAASASNALLRAQHEAQLAAAKNNPTEHFAAWMSTHAKGYSNDATEYGRRFANWLSNLEYAIAHNAKQTSYWLGLTSMADLSTEEYRRHLGFNYAAYKAQNRVRSSTFSYDDVDESTLPTAIDWRAKSAVAEVKNQAQCGSCWAFSATGAIEGINAIVTGKLVSLSEQELVDCDTLEDKGCSGGLMDNAFQFVLDNGGIDTEEDYPYTAMDGECQSNKLKRHVVTISGFEDVPENDESALKKAAAHQPVSVAIEADQKSFQLYMGGVYSDEGCGTDLDHGVLVVGYGKDPEEGPYWIVKNSWGADWGDKGYIKMKANVQDRAGLCGIAMVASYPTKNGPNPPEPGPEPGPDPGPGPRPGPKPGPQPVKCDDQSSCPAETTCCCITDIFNICLQWGCCPMVHATCCDDHQHCCPQEAPICDTAAGRCANRAGTFSTAWSVKLPAMRQETVFDRLFKRGGSGKSRSQPQYVQA